jgi:hypothetical protein
MNGSVPQPAQERAFLESVLYAALFDYPLTPTQLRVALIAAKADEQVLLEWYRHSDLLQHAIEYGNGYFFPRGRRDLLEIRRTREGVSRHLLRDLAPPLRLVSRMPFVRMVALSGSLAHLNADRHADLDLFVITAPGRVWSVTFTSVLLARLLGWRRQVCLNYVISERELRVSPADLFAANQIIHLRPVVGGEVLGRFLDANRFVARFYPNYDGTRDVAPAAGTIPRYGFRRAAEAVLTVLGAPLYERACRLLYGWHLRRRSHTWASREQVRLEPECLKLHTSSHRKDVMDRFDRAVTAALDAAETIRSLESIPARVAR